MEIKGAGFVNKGAELMLLSILQRLAPQFPKVKFVVAPRPGHNDYSKRARLGIYQKIWFQRYRIQFGYLGKLIPKKIRRMYGMVTHEEIDVVLDASGFTYSDQWGLGSTQAMEKAAKRWHKLGIPIILMPQAFGPFSSPKIRSSFKTLANCTEMIFPRDSVSYKHVVDVLGESPKIIQVPDFTISVKGTPPDSFEPGRIAIIPNYRMIDKTSNTKSSKYLPFLAFCIQHLLAAGEKPFFLIHEGKSDQQLAERMNEEFGFKLETHREEDALKLKGIIGTCNGVISSRFHGLVSALSQGVPALAIGWSHKYEMLLEDFDFSDGVLALDLAKEDVVKKLEVFTETHTRESATKKLCAAQKKNLSKVNEMWSLVTQIIQAKYEG